MSDFYDVVRESLTIFTTGRTTTKHGYDGVVLCGQGLEATFGLDTAYGLLKPTITQAGLKLVNVTPLIHLPNPYKFIPEDNVVLAFDERKFNCNMPAKHARDNGRTKANTIIDEVLERKIRHPERKVSLLVLYEGDPRRYDSGRSYYRVPICLDGTQINYKTLQTIVEEVIASSRKP